MQAGIYTILVKIYQAVYHNCIPVDFDLPTGISSKSKVWILFLTE